MIGDLYILAELDSRIAGHQQLHSEEGYSNSRNAIIIALKDLREWIMNELAKDLANFEKRETAKKEQNSNSCDCTSCD